MAEFLGLDELFEGRHFDREVKWFTTAAIVIAGIELLRCIHKG